MTWLLRLYPREWRRHYGAEIEEVVASQPKSIQLAVDLLGGAVDAHLKPQAFARRLDGAGPAGGSDMVNRLKGCDDVVSCITRRAALGDAALILGAAMLIAAMLIVVDNPLAKTIVLTMFPGLLVLPTQLRTLRGHSRLARFTLIVGPFVVLFLIGLIAGLAVSD